jgi:hypothetical protein
MSFWFCRASAECSARRYPVSDREILKAGFESRSTCYRRLKSKRPAERAGRDFRDDPYIADFIADGSVAIVRWMPFLGRGPSPFERLAFTAISRAAMTVEQS